MSVDLLEAHTFLADLLHRAGFYLIEQAQARTQNTAQLLNIQVKSSNSADLVTKADTDVEQMITSSISEKYPTHQIVGEESYSASGDKRYLVEDDRPCWIVDPIDGTVNWTHLFPNWCISAALCIKGQPVMGCILAPCLGGIAPNAGMTLFSAIQGQGSYLTIIESTHTHTSFSWPPTSNSTKLPYVSPPAPFPADAPAGCLFAAEWGKQRQDDPNGKLARKVRSFWNMASQYGSRGGKGGMVHGIRSLGSAALDVAYVATGAIDIFWEGGCWEWDVAAGMIILSEAGGVTFSANPPDDLEVPLPLAGLGSRLYLCLRGCQGDEGGTARQAQERVAKEVWKRVERIEYERPGA